MASEMEQGVDTRKSIRLFRFNDAARSVRSISAYVFEYTFIVCWTGSQTLGEEYCDIMQYAAKTKKPPSTRVSWSSIWHDSITELMPNFPVETRFAVVASHISSLHTFSNLCFYSTVLDRSSCE